VAGDSANAEGRPLHIIYPDPFFAERRRAATAMRAAGNALVGHHQEPEVLGELADLLEGFVERLEQGAARARPEDYMRRRLTDPSPADGSELLAFVDRTVSGPANPFATEMSLHIDREDMVGTVVFGSAFESAPQRAHGGMVSAVVDDVIGHLMIAKGIPAYTAELTVRYLAGVPLHEPIEFRARIRSFEGRKIVIEAEGRADEVRFVEAESLFITIPPDRLG